jgi:predicted heme/steroid binding protein
MNPKCAGLNRQLLRDTLNTAKIPKATQQRVLDAADTYEWYSGIVAGVQTSGSDVTVSIEGHGANSNVMSEMPFRFPPNASVFEAELKRAQSDSCMVLLYYQEKKDSAGNEEAIIASLIVYAKQEAYDLLSK